MDFPTDKQDWRASALCGSLTPEQADELFFIGPGKKAKRAQLFCAQCPVKKECRDFSILYEEQGIWAGMPDSDRKAIAPLLRPILKSEAIANGTLEERDVTQFIPQPYPFDPQFEGSRLGLAEGL